MIEGKPFKGFLCLNNADKSEYYLKNLESGEMKKLMEVSERLPKIGKFSYSEAVFEKANDYLCSITSGFVIIDEIGRLELDDKGFARGLRALLDKKEVDLYIVVREDFLPSVIRKFNIGEYHLIMGSTL